MAALENLFSKSKVEEIAQNATPFKRNSQNKEMIGLLEISQKFVTNYFKKRRTLRQYSTNGSIILC